MARLRKPLGQTGVVRAALALGGAVLIAGGALLALAGGLVLVPIGVVALTLAVVPARWSLQRGLLVGLLASPLLLGVGTVSYVGYSCVRPEPWLDVRFGDARDATRALTALANREDAFSASVDGDAPGEHRVFFERGAADTRDRVARELRASNAAVEVHTGEERCD
jgi:hypothetical protein